MMTYIDKQRQRAFWRRQFLVEMWDKPNILMHGKEAQDLELDKTRVGIPHLPFIDAYNDSTPLIRIIMGLQDQAETFRQYSPHWWPF